MWGRRYEPDGTKYRYRGLPERRYYQYAYSEQEKEWKIRRDARPGDYQWHFTDTLLCRGQTVIVCKWNGWMDGSQSGDKLDFHLDAYDPIWGTLVLEIHRGSRYGYNEDLSFRHDLFERIPLLSPFEWKHLYRKLASSSFVFFPSCVLSIILHYAFMVCDNSANN